MSSTAASETPFTALQSSLKALISTLEVHNAFHAQETQRRGKVYFMWDFVSNTLRMLEHSANNTEIKSDVVQRCMFANILFNDTSGKLTLMCGGDTTEFGDDIKKASDDCDKKAGQWGVADGVLAP